ncbi:MAG: thioredoxin-disulfide reductase [Lachnospiraceae bacterium]|nr:thioredoxin-disulfide reductase [Lachnospiraceae bacterium]MDY5741624.1 thioredoxin-disulfide reductase [Lachnospiraceae bacterium]
MIYDVIVAGGGPAGMTAVIYAQRAMLKTLVIEKNYMSGGQIINTYEVDNYPGLPGINGFDLAMQVDAHARKLGAEIVNADIQTIRVNDRTGLKEVVTDEGVFEAKTVIVCLGAAHRHVGVPGEQEFAGKGVSYCATCDGAFYRDKTVAVVGGGDVAIEDAIFLARQSKKVYVVHRRDSLRATKVLQEALFALPNVEMVWDSGLSEIKGDSKVSGVVIQNLKDDSLREVELDGVFIAIGLDPVTAAVKELLALNEQGYIVAGEDTRTNVPGIFAAGDIRTTPLRQIITAMADGAVAVSMAQSYLTEKVG